MPIYDDTRFCSLCGHNDHSIKDCPRNYCPDCNKQGHTRSRCPEILCYNCYRKGHVAERCPTFFQECTKCWSLKHSYDKCPHRFSETVYIRPPTNDNRKMELEMAAARLREKNRSNFPAGAVMPQPDITTRPARTSRWMRSTITSSMSGEVTPISQGDIPLKDKSSLCLKPEIEFPILEDVARDLIKNLSKKVWGEFDDIPYPEMILMHGGEEAVLRSVFESIPQEILDLQRKVLTLETLKEIREKQGPSDTWPINGGYCDIVTDVRDPTFWRSYVGQSKCVRVRVAQHLEAHRRQQTNTLHYYFISAANGTRHMNFLRLWSIPEKFLQDRNAQISVTLLNNILEMLMCYAFQSLPSTAMEYFMNLEVDTIGLNVLPPLLGGLNVAKDIRNRYREALRVSPDPYIREFPDMRSARGPPRAKAAKKNACVEPSWTIDQYQSSVIQALQTFDTQLAVDTLNLDTNAEASKDFNLSALLQDTALPDDAEPLVTPFGTASARIGVVLERCLVRVEDNAENLKNNVCALPELLWDARFTESNSLIWTSDLRQTLRKFSTSQEDHGSKLSESLQKFHRTLIDQSNLKMIMICGPYAKTVCLTPEIMNRKIQIDLRGGTRCEAYVELEQDEVRVKRIYIHIDSLPIYYGDDTDWDQLRLFSEIIRLMSTLTKVEDIRCFIFQRALASQMIISQYMAEQQTLCEPMTIQTLDPRVREWLALKGIIHDEQIRKWEAIAGSLSRGLFLLLCSLPRIPDPRERRQKSTIPIPRSANPRTFTKEEIDRSKEQYTQITGYSYQNLKANVTSTTSGDIGEASQTSQHLRAPRPSRSSKANVTSTTSGDIGEASQTSQHLRAPRPSRSSKAKKEISAVFSAVASAVGKLDMRKSSNTQHETITFEELDDMVVSADSAQDDDRIDSDEFREILNTVNALDTLEAADSDEDFTEEVKAKPQIPQSWSLRTDTTRQALLTGRVYIGRSRPAQDTYAIHHSHFEFYFKHPNVNLKEGFMVTLQLSPYGTRNPHVFAWQAQNDDPASRIAVHVQGKLLNGKDFELYAEQSDKAWKDPMRWNAIHDWLSGMSWEEIAFANEPRRYLKIHNAKSVPEAIRKFTYYEFTDNSLTSAEEKIWKKEKAGRSRTLEKHEQKRTIWGRAYLGKRPPKEKE